MIILHAKFCLYTINSHFLQVGTQREVQGTAELWANRIVVQTC